MPIMRDSFLYRPGRGSGWGQVSDSNWNQHSLVHAIEQPITNIVHETKTVINGTWRMSDSVMKLAAYWVGGWMIYTVVGDMFPREKRAFESTVSRAWKRARLE